MMNKTELEVKVKRLTDRWFDSHLGDMGLAQEIVELVELDSSPAKEVIPRKWAEYIEYWRSHDGGEIDLTYAAYSTFPEMVDGTGRNAAKLLRAVVNGYTIAPEKKYLLPMPMSVNDHDDAQFFAEVDNDGDWKETEDAFNNVEASGYGFAVSQAQIDSAPAWVKALEKVEVNEDEK